MDVFKVVRPRALGDLIAYEADPNYCRESGVYLAGSGAARLFPQFAVLGAILTGTAVVTAGAVVSASGGTPGNGAIGTVTADAGAMEGEYLQVFLEPGSDAGVFELLRPDGMLDGTGKVGVAYDGMLNFTQADGANDFVEGDKRPIVVTRAAPIVKYVPIDFAGVDGRQVAAGVNLFGTQAPDGTDGDGVVERRGPSIVRAEELAWPVGATSAQKLVATRQLEALGILVRNSG